MAQHDEVAAKTTPNLRDETRTDNGQTFEVDFTHRLDDTGNVSADERERDETAARTQAAQRGLVPTGPVKLGKTEKLDDGRNVRFVYQVPVELNRPASVPGSGVSVAAQPDDTAASLPEKK